MSEKTKETIWAIADELGYKPNLWARQLVKGHSSEAVSERGQGKGKSVASCQFLSIVIRILISLPS